MTFIAIGKGIYLSQRLIGFNKTWANVPQPQASVTNVITNLQVYFITTCMINQPVLHI